MTAEMCESVTNPPRGSDDGPERCGKEAEPGESLCAEHLEEW